MDRLLAGNSNIRNPVLASFVAKGILPYHGLGSGIMRVMELCPNAKFVDDKDGVQFKAILPRGTWQTGRAETSHGDANGEADVTMEKLGEKLGEKRRSIIEEISRNPVVTTFDLMETLSVSQTAVEKNIAWLKEHGYIRRVGGDKGGHWEVTR